MNRIDNWSWSKPIVTLVEVDKTDVITNCVRIVAQIRYQSASTTLEALYLFHFFIKYGLVVLYTFRAKMLDNNIFAFPLSYDDVL